MASQLAEEISETVDSTTNHASLIDDDLSEVVGVLRGLMQGGCWCGVDPPLGADEMRPAVAIPHSDECMAAQKLWLRLETF